MELRKKLERLSSVRGLTSEEKGIICFICILAYSYLYFPFDFNAENILL